MNGHIFKQVMLALRALNETEDSDGQVTKSAIQHELLLVTYSGDTFVGSVVYVEQSGRYVVFLSGQITSFIVTDRIESASLVPK